MAETKKDQALRGEIRGKALTVHKGFVDMVAGNIDKHGGYEEIAKAYMSINGPVGPYWLKKALERVLDFAEKIQVKEAPTELKGAITVTQMPAILKGDKPLEFDIGGQALSPEDP